jgi:uncharacterized protein
MEVGVKSNGMPVELPATASPSPNRLPLVTLLVFAKLPIKGAAKTRIAAASSVDFAHSLYLSLLDATLLATLNAKTLAKKQGFDMDICWHYAGDLFDVNRAALAKTGGLPSAILSVLDLPNCLYPQDTVNDLGLRMCSALSSVSGPCLLYGSDIPGLTAERLLEAAKALLLSGPGSMVFNPSIDGGYCLIGNFGPNQALRALLTDMEWSHNGVMAQTRIRLQNLKVPYSELDPLDDIDTLAQAKAYLKVAR